MKRLVQRCTGRVLWIALVLAGCGEVSEQPSVSTKGAPLVDPLVEPSLPVPGSLSGPGGICFSDLDCSPGAKCIAKRCQSVSIDPNDPVTGCRSDKDCPTFTYCAFGTCHLKSGYCANDKDCKEGYACNPSHYCQKRPNYCDNDGNCPTYQQCLAHLCKPRRCFNNNTCGSKSYFCKFFEFLKAQDNCGQNSNAGQCSYKPSGCDTIDATGYPHYSQARGPDTVKGCDGLYYKSDKAAFCNSVSVKERISCNSCTANAYRCSGISVQKCQLDSDQCLAWQNLYTCDDGCYHGSCCNNECSTVGQRTCNDGDVYKCVVGLNSCNQKQKVEDCNYGCSNGACKAETKFSITLSFSRSCGNFGCSYESTEGGNGACVALGKKAVIDRINNPASFAITLYHGNFHYDVPAKAGLTVSSLRPYLEGAWAVQPWDDDPSIISTIFEYRCK